MGITPETKSGAPVAGSPPVSAEDSSSPQKPTPTDNGLFRLREIVAILSLAAVYFSLGKFGLSLAFINRSASAVWPPTGIALAALLLFGLRLWPGIFIGAFLVNITTQGSVLTTLGIAMGNTLEGIAGAWLVKCFAKGAKAFESGGGV